MNKKRSMLFILIAILLILGGCQSQVFFQDNKQQNLDGISKNVNNGRPPASTRDKSLEKEAEPITDKTVDNPKVEMIFTGDVMMDSYIGNYIKENGVDYPWSDVQAILKNADIAAVNLETSVSLRGETKKPKGYGFHSQPYTLEGLKNSGIDIVSLANNHIKDFGEIALFDTIDHLDQYGIKHVGAGENLNSAEQMAIIERNGLKIGFLAFSSIIPWDSWKATESSSGVASFNSDDYERILNKINQSKNQVDILTVILHWGKEYHDIPEQWQIDLAHKIIDNGADLLIGHHPHVLQGIEIYKNKPILYSTGNFIFLKKNEEAGKTGMFKLTFTKNEGFVSGKVDPIFIKYTKAHLLKETDPLYKNIIEKLNKLSKQFSTQINEKGEF